MNNMNNMNNMNKNNFNKYMNNYMRRLYSNEYISLILNFIYELSQTTSEKYILEVGQELKLSRYQIACQLSKMFYALKLNENNEFDNEYLTQDFNYIFNELKVNNSTNISKFTSIEEYYLSLNSNNINLDPDEINILSIEKIKFIINYFINIYKMKDNYDFLNQLVIFKLHKGIPNINLNNNISLINNITLSNTLMDYMSDPNIFMMNFANKYVGGKVLTNGNCQEEIKFLTNPELIILKSIFRRHLEDNEVITIKNTIKYSNYTGYGYDLIFKSNNELLNIENILEVDALQFSKSTNSNKTSQINNTSLHVNDQYKKCNIDREINKLLIGFNAVISNIIVTGNFGGGAFNGDPILKFLIQWYSSILTDKKLIYCTNDSALYSSIENIISDTNIKSTTDIITKIYNYKK